MPSTPWGPYPWEPGGAWDTSAQAQPTAAPPDTSARDELIKQLAAKHGAQVGTATTVYNKPTSAQTSAAKTQDDRDKLKASLDSGFDLYTFTDGTTIELSQDGQSQNYKQGTTKTPTAASTAANAGLMIVGNQVWQKNPTPDDGRGPYIPTTASQATQQLTDAETVAKTNLSQAQAKLQDADAQLKLDPTNIALSQAKDAAQIQLNNAQSAAQLASANAANVKAQIDQAKLPSDIAQTQATTAAQQANAQKTIGMLPYDQLLSQAQAGNYGAQAKAIADKTPYDIQNLQAQATNYLAQAQATTTKAAEPTVWQTGTTAPTTSYYDPKTGQVVDRPNPSYLPTDPGRMTQQLQQQATAQYQALQQQVASGKITNDQAASQFNQYWDQNIEPLKGDIAASQAKAQQALALQAAQTNMYNAQAANYPAQLAETASSNAQKNLISMLPYVTGKGFDQAFGKALTQGWQGMNPSDVAGAATYSLPNLQEVGRQGAAAALANISPIAQQHLNTPGPTAQPQVGGVPDLSGLLNRGSYSFGAPAAGGVGTTPAAPVRPGMSSMQTPGFNIGAMPGAGIGGQSTQLPPGVPRSWQQSALNFGSYGGTTMEYNPARDAGQIVPIPNVPTGFDPWSLMTPMSQAWGQYTPGG